jgi:uncharacterized membrane protein
MKVVGICEHLVHPVMEHLPASIRFPTVIASLLLFFACFFSGLIARMRIGQVTGAFVEELILKRIPGYKTVRSFARRLGNVEESAQFQPVFVEIEEALVPAFIVEEHADGQCTVVVPSAPTPGVGAIYILPARRVHAVDAPFLNMVQAVSGWGAGCAELLKTVRNPARLPKH